MRVIPRIDEKGVVPSCVFETGWRQRMEGESKMSASGSYYHAFPAMDRLQPQPMSQNKSLLVNSHQILGDEQSDKCIWWCCEDSHLLGTTHTICSLRTRSCLSVCFFVLSQSIFCCPSRMPGMQSFINSSLFPHSFGFYDIQDQGTSSWYPHRTQGRQAGERGRGGGNRREERDSADHCQACL